MSDFDFEDDAKLSKRERKRQKRERKRKARFWSALYGTIAIMLVLLFLIGYWMLREYTKTL